MAKRLTTFSKLLITLLILAVLFFGIRFVLNSTEFGQNISKTESKKGKNTSSGPIKIDLSNKNKDKNNKTSSTSGDEEALKVQVVTWGGFAPGLYFNEGLKSSEYSRFWKEYGLKVDFILMDDMVASYQAFSSGRLDLRTNTLDGMILEYEGVAEEKPEIILQTDWSRGGDVLIGRRGINSINDLRGKKIALTPMTPSQTFLMMALDAAGMTLEDIQIVESPDNPTAATIFKSGDVDAAVVWSPTHFEILENVPGTKILQSTKDAAYALAGIFYAKKDYIEKNPEKIQKFYEGWMKAAGELQNPANMEKASKILGETYDMPAEDAMGMMFDAYMCNHGDNQNFFGLNTANNVVKGETVYDNISDLFTKQQVLDGRVPSWRSLVSSMAASRTKLTGSDQIGEKQKTFRAPTKQEREAPAISSKPVSITFPTGVSTLSENAKTIIDLEFADVVKTYANSRIRVEGNTDNVGARDMNVRLSQSRANAVATYLKSAYGIDGNRLIIIGNGPDNPVKGCETNATETCKAKNRRTEFQLTAAE